MTSLMFVIGVSLVMVGGFRYDHSPVVDDSSKKLTAGGILAFGAVLIMVSLAMV